MLNRRNLLVGGVCSTGLLSAPAVSRERFLEGSTMRQRIERDIRSWDAISDHRTGSEGANQTTSWLAREIGAVGLTAKVDTFPFERRVLHECFVEAGANRADGVPLFDGGYTDALGVSGVLGSLESSAAVGLTEFSPVPVANQSLEYARREARFAAIIAVARGDNVRPGLSLQNADAYLTPYGPPVLQVATEHRTWLQATLDKEIRLVANLTLQSVPASNVQVRIAGRNPSLAPVVIMTPISAWWTCTSERAGGIAVWLECIRFFAVNEPERDLIFTANTGHELGHVGLDHYLNENPGLIGEAHAWIHLGANFAARDGRVRFQASSEQLMARGLSAFENRMAAVSDITPFHERPYGEARNIYDGGGQYVSILGSNFLFHHPDDRWPHAVDIEKTTMLTRVMLDVAKHLARA